MDFLRDPIWSCVSVFVAIISLIFGIAMQRGRLGSIYLRALVYIASLFAGTIIFAMGYVIIPTLVSFFEIGAEKTWELLRSLAAMKKSEILPFLLVLGLMPGGVTAISALTGDDLPERLVRGIISAIIILFLMESFAFFFLYKNATFVTYARNVLIVAISGLAGGIIIGSIVHFLDEYFDAF